MNDNEEIQYWFDIWDSMSIDQKERIQDILQIEKDKLEALEKEADRTGDRSKVIAYKKSLKK